METVRFIIAILDEAKVARDQLPLYLDVLEEMELYLTYISPEEFEDEFLDEFLEKMRLKHDAKTFAKYRAAAKHMQRCVRSMDYPSDILPYCADWQVENADGRPVPWRG